MEQLSTVSETAPAHTGTSAQYRRVRHHLERQSGVVARAQLLADGLCDHDIERLVRRRELSPLRRGVYVDHTGAPSWVQQAWGAVLLCRTRPVAGGPPPEESAALRGRSALVAVEGTPPRGTWRFEVVVADGRRLDVPTDIRVRRSSAALASARWHLAPPRVRLEDAVVDVASEQERMVDLVAEVSRAVGSRRTTPARLLTRLDDRLRIPRRRALAGVLRDLAEGTCSALEHGYLTHVERPHALPRPLRQTRARLRTAVIYRDAEYEGLVVELDGRAWHDSVAQRDRDADRDLMAAVNGRTTVRLTWGQVFDRPCWTAGQIAGILAVTPRRCSPTCTADDP